MCISYDKHVYSNWCNVTLVSLYTITYQATSFFLDTLNLKHHLLLALTPPKQFQKLDNSK